MLTRVELRSGNHDGDKRGNPEAKRSVTAHQMMISAMAKATGRPSAKSLRRRGLESCNLESSSSSRIVYHPTLAWGLCARLDAWTALIHPSAWKVNSRKCANKVTKDHSFARCGETR